MRQECAKHSPQAGPPLRYSPPKPCWVWCSCWSVIHGTRHRCATPLWAAHRYRTGADVSAAVPYFVLGFRFQGEFLPNPASWHEKTEPKRKRRRSAA